MKLSALFEQEKQFEITGWEERKLRGGDGPDTEDYPIHDEVHARDREEAIGLAKKMFPKAHGLRVVEIKHT